MFPQSLPFDSYYKFLFIGGIALIISSQIFFQNNRELHIKHNHLMDSLHFEMRKDSLKLYLTKSTLNKITKGDLRLDSSTSLAMDKDFQSMNDRLSTGTRILNDIDADHEKLDSQKFLYYFLFFLGLGCSVFGAYKWHIEQSVRDLILRRELDIINLEYRKKARELDQIENPTNNENPN